MNFLISNRPLFDYRYYFISKKMVVVLLIINFNCNASPYKYPPSNDFVSNFFSNKIASKKNVLLNFHSKLNDTLPIKKDSKTKDFIILKKIDLIEFKKQKDYTSKLSVLIFVIVFILQYFILALWNNKIKNRLLSNQNKLILEKVKEIENEKAKVSQSLFERELLLKEIHHRVKNNLQIVISLLRIQAIEGGDISIEDFIIKGQSRINSMALVHQSLYENDKLDSIDFQDYLSRLVLDIKNMLSPDDSKTVCTIDAEGIFFDIQTAIPLGLIINELLSNSFKHAFDKIENSTIDINIKKSTEGNYILSYRDNGIGFSTENRSGKSLGLELVDLLAKQIKGLVVKKNESLGTSYSISFKEIIN